ncbi:MAG: class I SAM-dependent methyltransferase [Thermoguttaceae bacterium]
MMATVCDRRLDSMVERRAGRRCPTPLCPTPLCPAPLCLAPWFAILLVCSLIGEVRPETPAQDAPRAAQFPELADACLPIAQFVSGNTILVGEDKRAGPCDPIPPQARMLAFEENSHFLCATADVSDMLRDEGSTGNPGDQPAFVRRFLLLKPSIVVVDDVVRPAGSGDSVRSRLRCQETPTVTGRQLHITVGDSELVCETLWPVSAKPSKVTQSSRSSESVYQVEVKPKGDADAVRLLHVLQLRQTGNGDAPAKSVLTEKDGRLELTITTSDRVFRLGLPSPNAGAGRIAIESVDGKQIVARRPLPCGVLPHGPDGIALLERWDRAYRDGRRPPWDTGLPAPDLKRAVENGDIRPCRTVVLGCGSGTNAIYLAGKGFDVTAIDLAPTALGIAQAKAEKAGVSVRWVLADVLALPELEPFELIFDRGCYHNVRYVDAPGFVESTGTLSRPGTLFLLLSLNRDGPPGVREHHMREDYSSLFDFQWLRESGLVVGQEASRRSSWSALLRRKDEK